MVDKPQRLKKYKDKNPAETVAEIKEILKTIGIETLEDCYFNEQAGVYSCNVYISNAELKDLRIGTNGKGMSEEYSLASGYAEFMERLQNGILFGLDSDSYFDSEKKPAAECAEEISKFFEDNFGPEEKASGYFLSNTDEFRMIPFREYGEDTKKSVPLDLLLRLCTSNGMCAGNSEKEALIQGISEIFERYSQRRIIMDKLCPPVIPDIYFEDTEILRKLDGLARLGIEHEIRDCSLKMGLPVIGVYLKRGDGAQVFHLGSDPSPVTALERCITEIFQGMDTVDEAEFHLADSSDYDESFWKYQLQLCSWGGNIYPAELSSGSPDWDFDGFEHPVSKSNDDDFEYYISIIERLGKKLYIRDASFFGFPSYWCYIPGISTFDFCFDDGTELKNYYAFSNKLANARNLPSMKKKELRSFASDYMDYLEAFWYYETDYYRKRFYPEGVAEKAGGSMYLLAARLYAAAGYNAEAADAMENHIVSASLDEKDEAVCDDFIAYMMSGKSALPETKKLLKIGTDTFPVCPECGKCGLKTLCRKNQLDEFIKNCAAFQKTGFLKSV